MGETTDGTGTIEAMALYRALRDRIDAAGGRLVDMHCKHITCKAGCSDCCTDFTISAVEYNAILEDLRAAGVKSGDLAFDPDAACAYLNGGLCMLYRFRPLICRTHGLPIAFVNDEEPPPQVNVSFCPKNFNDADPDDLDFGPENTLDLDGLNAELAEANSRFLEAAGESGLPPARRIPLRQLRADLAGGQGRETAVKGAVR